MTRWLKIIPISLTLLLGLIYLSLSVGSPTLSVPFKQFTVVIDPGHGGNDPGALGVGGACEKEITLAIAKMIYLKSLAHPELRVVLSRRNDEYIVPSDRVLEANRIGADVYVSVHANAYASSSISGVETFVHETERYPSASYRLAALLQRHVVSETNAEDRGVKRASLFIRHATMPAALVEVGFLTNRLEAQRLQSLAYQGAIADAILDAVLEFLHNS